MERGEVKGLSPEKARKKLDESLEPGADTLYYDTDRFCPPRAAPPNEVAEQAPLKYVKTATEFLAETNFVDEPAPVDATAPQVIARRRRIGRYYTQEILLSVGIIGAVTYFAWILLQPNPESSQHRPAPPADTAIVVAPPVPVPPPSVQTAAEAPLPMLSAEKPKTAKPARPKPSPIEATEPADPIDPLLNRSFQR